MRFIFSLMLFLVFMPLVSAETATETITFKGMALDKEGESEKLFSICMQNKTNQSYDYCDKTYIKDNRWGFYADYGNLVNVWSVFSIGENQKITEIQMYSVRKEVIPELVKIVESKYGKPKISVDSVENGFGTKFENKIYSWVDTEGNKIRVDSMHRKVDSGKIAIESAAIIKAKEKLDRDLKETGKANL